PPGAASARMARAAASPGSPAAPPGALESTLRTCSTPCGDMPITSVKVPPRSIQNCQPGPGCEDDWLRVSIACIIRAYESGSQRDFHSTAAGGIPARGVLSRPGEWSLGAQD